ncbi:hypothetical protein [Olivibacter jilunii]|uniref:hypothetical protein n=1 Tax=Olivibacter jilunii TaxID=985016 RepID=UPI001032242E|nr:hypothetical protein [Olivibacter jilunii]
MGEYVKYGSKVVKIGTCESLYYTSYEKYLGALFAGQLGFVDGNIDPRYYARPNAGFRFRFPFPDEDKMPMGHSFDHFDRGVSVKVGADVWHNKQLDASQLHLAFTKDHVGQVIGTFRSGVLAPGPVPVLPVKKLPETMMLDIVFQKPVYRQSDGKFILALVLREPITGDMRRLEEDKDIRKFLKDLIKYQVAPDGDQHTRQFYRMIGARVMKGYSLELNGQRQLRSADVEQKMLSAPNDTLRRTRHFVGNTKIRNRHL